uniref:ABC transporter ATP-binding protein n=1 Tax=Ndongobacter massiliensis TaxID=1871025 RepID=UPI0009302886|nr:ABC transporter ATP-binding protein [Ndongobacter massiliensis]
MLLEMNHITKYFGAFCANEDISLHLDRGEVLALVGENGAGKSTMMKILYGLEQPTEGEIRVDGKTLRIENPVEAIRAGIGMVQQNFMLFHSLSVTENIVYGCEPRKGMFFDRVRAREEVLACSKKYGLPIDPDAKISELPVGLQQRVEILKVLYQDPEIVIFDEPTAVLTPSEIEQLLQTIRDIAAKGKGVILITHKLREVEKASDRVVVLRRGKKVGSRKTSETNAKELSYLMVGKHLPEMNIEELPQGRPVLEVEDLRYAPRGVQKLDGINLHVNEGEIVGIAGVSGNGQVELISALSGMLREVEGHIRIDGVEVTNQSVREISEHDTAYVPEDRFATGCAAESSVFESSIIGYHRQDAYCHRGILRKKELSKLVDGHLSDYRVAYESQSQRCGALSGGNLQKLIIARELERGKKLNLIAEPTRGVDIGAQEFIYEKLLERRREGKALLMISSDLSEIMRLSDRIYVIYNGKIVCEAKRNELSSEEIGYYMLNGARKTEEA